MHDRTVTTRRRSTSPQRCGFSPQHCMVVMVGRPRCGSGGPSREEWDSNPRAPCGTNGFQDRRLRPLGHPPDPKPTRSERPISLRGPHLPWASLGVPLRNVSIVIGPFGPETGSAERSAPDGLRDRRAVCRRPRSRMRGRVPRRLHLRRIRKSYINPDECVDCGACEPVCPVTAIFGGDDCPDEWSRVRADRARVLRAGRHRPREPWRWRPSRRHADGPSAGRRAPRRRRRVSDGGGARPRGSTLWGSAQRLPGCLTLPRGCPRICTGR